MAVLLGMSDQVKGQTFPIESDEVTIGRSHECTIPVENSTVSGRHCSVLREDRRYQIQDHGSTNGTRLNSMSVSTAYLKPKDLIQVGSVEFMFDGEDVEIVESESGSTQIEESAGPTAAPETFINVSPFGARRRERRGPWFPIIMVVGLVTLLVMILYFIRLFGAT